MSERKPIMLRPGLGWLYTDHKVQNFDIIVITVSNSSWRSTTFFFSMGRAPRPPEAHGHPESPVRQRRSPSHRRVIIAVAEG